MLLLACVPLVCGALSFLFPCIWPYSPWSCWPHLQWTNGLQWGTQAKWAWCWTGHCPTWEGNWIPALILALLKPQLRCFCDCTKGNGTLETQGSNSARIKITHPPVPVSENSFPQNIGRNLPPGATAGDKDLSYSVTISVIIFS